MGSIVVATNFANFSCKKRLMLQDNALRVLSCSPKNVFPVAFNFSKSNIVAPHIQNINILKCHSKDKVNNNRDLPYVKEILYYASRINCNFLGFINSDILLNRSFYDSLEEKYDCFIFSRNDIADISPDQFLQGKIKIIPGGDQHIGADGFFFRKKWWIKNQHLFPGDLILGETEWDTTYRAIIKNESKSYFEGRLLYHVYHDQAWNTKSNGATNNIKIWEKIKKKYDL
jgi:hypothetical protein